MKPSGIRLVVVSNRLPVVVKQDKGKWNIRQGSGGLVTALAPILRNRGGLWIGWSGSSAKVNLRSMLDTASQKTGYVLRPVTLTEEDIADFYYGFSNEVMWPIFHDLQTRCNFVPAYWYQYLSVNKKFAKVIAEQTGKNDYIWVHDYHLMHVAHNLRGKRKKNKIGFFLHIPFPPMDIFLKLPWRGQILHALLEYDLVGFQTLRDRRNFIQCVQTLIPDAQARGKGQVVTVTVPGRTVRVGTFPISIDYGDFAQQAASKKVSEGAWYFHEDLPDRQIILSVDRLDYTKGIPERLEAIRNALLRFPDMHLKATFCQVVVPSREEVPEYQALKAQIEQLVGEINGQFTKSGWAPIHYIYRSLERHELLACYRAAEIVLVTPLKDGMNLVAKEYCACNIEENGVIVLSEFAGAAAQLHKNALLVNPYDVEAVADTIYKAFTMNDHEKRMRMKKLRQSIRKHDIFWWLNSFLSAAFTKHLDDFPVLDEYVPQIEIE
ncbi:MAG: trehalose-6-phosphate synthase [Deltaproteobacteria bacterium]|nr:trehalose-6-phosphate synthase [Deltaproteobacteria bacterium]